MHESTWQDGCGCSVMWCTQSSINHDENARVRSSGASVANVAPVAICPFIALSPVSLRDDQEVHPGSVGPDAQFIQSPCKMGVLHSSNRCIEVVWTWSSSICLAGAAVCDHEKWLVGSTPR